MSLLPATSLISILDNDFYKFTMQQGAIRLFPAAKARYKFINRGKHSFPEGFSKALREAVDKMALLQLTEAQSKGGDWTGAVKLSDEKGKYTGSERMIGLAKAVFQIE